MQIETLKKLGFSDKTAKVYLALLRLGPSSVRSLADASGLNRGTTYDALKWLQDADVVTFYKKESKQQFVAEHPDHLHRMVATQQDSLRRVDQELDKLIPELSALHSRNGERPVARYYEKRNIKEILEDVLETCERDTEGLYRIYSAVGIREYLYDNFPTFSDARIAKGISVKVIAIGEGGELRGMDERKWLKTKPGTPTYIILYPGKTAYISLNAKKEPIGVVIENDGVYETQKAVFETLWNTL
jgi:sugar-specific transcriptional regulator TrmB